MTARREVNMKARIGHEDGKVWIEGVEGSRSATTT
jgi:hypothetical protein